MAVNIKGMQGMEQARQAQRLSEQQVSSAQQQLRPGEVGQQAGPSIAEQIAAFDAGQGKVSGQEFEAAQAPVSEEQPRGMHGFLAAQKVGEKKLMPGGPNMEIERGGRLWSNSFWAKGEGVDIPTARLDFDQNGDVRGWILDPSQYPPARAPIVGKYDSGAMLSANTNPAPIAIKTEDGQKLTGKVSVYQDGSIDLQLDNGLALGTAPDLGDRGKPMLDLVRGPLYGENPGGAYGHSSRLEFDLDGSVRGWVLGYSEAEDIHRDPFKGTWSLDGDRLTLTFTEDGEQKVLTGTVTEDGVTLGDGEDRRFKLGRVTNLESFFDA